MKIRKAKVPVSKLFSLVEKSWRKNLVCQTGTKKSMYSGRTTEKGLNGQTITKAKKNGLDAIYLFQKGLTIITLHRGMTHPDESYSELVMRGKTVVWWNMN